jgi:hypothetical protein
MSQHRFIHPVPGPITLRISAPEVRIEVVAVDDEQAEAVIRIDLDQRIAADVSAAVIRHQGSTLTVELPGSGEAVPLPPRNPEPVGTRRGLGDVTGGLMFLGSRVLVAGREIVPGEAARSVSAATLIRATLPAGSALQVTAAYGDVLVEGDLRDVRVTTLSGDIAVYGARSATLESVSGDVCARAVGSASVITVSGGILVEDIGVLTASSMSGDIAALRVPAASRIDTATGDLQVAYADD